VKLSHVLQQIQDANFNLLDNLRATDQASQSLHLQPPLAAATSQAGWE
jgi:hypothetical protein